MRNLKIGISDDVLIDIQKYNIKFGKEFFKKEPINPNSYSIRQMYGCSKLKEIIYWFKYYKKYFPRSNIVSAIQILSFDGNKFYEISTHLLSNDNILGKYSRNVFENWHMFNKLHFNDYIYCKEEISKDKLIAHNKLDIDIMIETNKEDALYLANNGVKVLLFDSIYNKNINHKNIIRVKSCSEICKTIITIKKMKKEDIEFKRLSEEEINKLTQYEYDKYLRSYKNYLLNKQYDKKLNNNYDSKFKMINNLAMFNIINVEGYENVPIQPGLIFASNQIEKNDPFYVSKALKNRPLRCAIISDVRNAFIEKIYKNIGFTLVNMNDDKNFLEEKLCVDLVNNNDILVIPEELNTEKIKNLKVQTVAMSQKTGAAIIPLAIKHDKKYKLFKTTTVSFGNPIIVNKTDNLKEKEEKLNEEISFLADSQKIKQLI
jgi:hypothetical protein